MSYDGGCGDVNCKLCAKDADDARTKRAAVLESEYAEVRGLPAPKAKRRLKRLRAKAARRG